MRSLFIGVCAALSFLLIAPLLIAPRQALGFGGEDVRNGNPWHHEDITRRGLTKSERYEGAGFSPPAADDIAWHADYIDSYLYNPLFWAEGIATEKSLARLDAALAGYADLAKLHFDDTFTTPGLRANWERYASGTLAGLYWASLQGSNGDLAAGQNILGVSFHAVQDFYSHSNWVDDPGRRCKTWFQTPPAQRTGLALYSGAYELARSGAPAHHGAYSLSCSLVRGETLDKALGPICTGYSPLQNTNVCEEWRRCGGGKPITVSVKGKQNDKLVFLAPPGIALDTTWMSRVQAVNRRLVDSEGKFAPGKDGMHFRREACKAIVNASGRDVCKLDADQVFAGTKDLAIRASTEWATYLERAMKAMGPQQGSFWERLKKEKSDKTARARQYEDFSRLPYQFLAAGPYPVANPTAPDRESAAGANGWYLRLRVKTAATRLAETDSDIFARVRVNGADKDYLLDYLPTDDTKGRANNRLLVYDDFEAGRDTAYMIGPFDARPQTIALYNNSGSSVETLGALLKDLSNAASGAVKSARRALISVIAGNADYVGEAVRYRAFAEIAEAVPSDFPYASIEEKLRIDGGDQGVHEITYRVRRVPTNLTYDERQQGWIAFEVQLHKLKTLRESKVDRTTGADEPFVIFHIAPLNGRPDPAHSYLTEPLSDMDTGDVYVFARRTGSAAVVKVPPGGGLVVSAQVFESDSESASDREELMRTFASGFDEKTRAPAAKFADEIGRLLGADWTAESVEAFAFKRGAVPQAGPVLTRRPVGEVRGDQVSAAFKLDWGQVRSLLTADRTIDGWAADPVDAKVLDGVWHARGYDCDGPVAYDSVDVSVKGVALEARKIIGTPCGAARTVSWHGVFKDGIVKGEFLKSPSPRALEEAKAKASHVAETMPNYYDKTIHPMIGLEGNWIIKWQNSTTPPAYAVLTKGPQYGCAGEAGGGCWYQFSRDPKAPWRVDLIFPPHGSNGSVTMSPTGELSVEYPNGVLGGWGGTSKVAARNGAITGEWSYADTKGRETWTRMNPVVTEVEVRAESTSMRGPLGKPVTLTVPYRDASYGSYGRPNAELRLYGRDLWGLHYYWLPRESDVEIGGPNGTLAYICVYDGQHGYAVHGTFGVCLDQGGVLGVVLYLYIWPNARSGPHTVHFNDQRIVFNLEVTGQPQKREPIYGWRPMKLEMASCSTLHEINPPAGELPLEFGRSDFRRR